MRKQNGTFDVLFTFWGERKHHRSHQAVSQSSQTGNIQSKIYSRKYPDENSHRLQILKSA
jgi:hypothetical protein